MNNRFNILVSKMKQSLDELLAQSPRSPIAILHSDIEHLDLSGVYLFSQFNNGVEEFLYVGQCNSIKKRLKQHCAISNRKCANFAYELTVKRTGIGPKAYTPSNTKEKMFEDQSFLKAFNDSIDYIKQMNFKYIPMDGKLEKNLFEIYVATSLNTEFNDFGT